MATSSYELELVDHDGTSLGELPEAQLVNVTWKNNAPGAIEFALKQTNPRVSDVILHQHEVRLYIEDWPEADEVPWQGPVLDDQQDSNLVDFTGQTLEFYLTKRYIDFSSLLYDDIPAGYDQVVIGWGLMQYAQGIPVANVTINNPDKDLRITAGPMPPASVSRLRKYDRADHQSIMDCLSEFPTLVDYVSGAANGFDWYIKCFKDGRREWTPFTPTRGQRQSGLTLEYGRNITAFKVSESTVNYVNRAICTGGSDGDTKIENEYKDAAEVAVKGEFMGITTDGDEKDPDELGGKARGFVQARNHPIVDPDLQAVRVPVDLLGVLQPGDTVPVSIHRGRTQLEADYRIDSIKWSVRPNYLELSFVPLLGDSS